MIYLFFFVDFLKSFFKTKKHPIAAEKNEGRKFLMKGSLFSFFTLLFSLFFCSRKTLRGLISFYLRFE